MLLFSFFIPESAFVLLLLPPLYFWLNPCLCWYAHSPHSSFDFGVGVRRINGIERLAFGVDVDRLSVEAKDKDEEEGGPSECGVADVKDAASNATRAVKTSFFRGVLTIF